MQGFSIKENGLYFNDILKNKFLPAEILKDRKYTLYAFVIVEDGSLYLKFGEAKNESIYKRYNGTGMLANKSMISVWQSEKGDKEIHAELKKHRYNNNFKWAGQKSDNITNSCESYIINNEEGLDFILAEITRLSAGKVAKRQSIKKLYKNVVEVANEVVNTNYEHYLCDLCPRFGKTNTTLQIIEKMTEKVAFMVSYVGTVRTSYLDSILSYKDYENIHYIDPDDCENPVEEAEEWLKKGFKIFWYVAITGDESVNARRTFDTKKLKKYGCMLFIEEVDFGAHCKQQARKIRTLYKNTGCKKSVALTGTNPDRSEEIFKSDYIISKDYIVDILPSKDRDDAVAIEWNILNNNGMVNYFNYIPNEMENFSDMFSIENGKLKGEAYFREVLNFIFMKKGLKDTRETRLLKKSDLIDEDAVTMIFTPRNNESHKLLKKLIEYNIPNSLAIILDGNETTNSYAENDVKLAIKDNPGKKIFLIATDMANRSFSVKEIKNIILFIDDASYASIAQKIARGWTPYGEQHNVCHIIDFRMNYSSDACAAKYLSGYAEKEFDEKAGIKKNERQILDEIESTEKITFNEYLGKERPIKKLDNADIRKMLETKPYLIKKAFHFVYEDLDSVTAPAQCGVNEKIEKSTLLDAFGANIKGDKRKKILSKFDKKGKKTEEEKEAEENNDKLQHFLFLVNHFQLFDTGYYQDDILLNEFKSMSRSRKEEYEKAFGIDMHTMYDIAKILKNKSINIGGYKDE